MPTVGQLILLSLAITSFALGGLASLARLRGEGATLRLLIRAGLMGGILACASLLIWRIVSNHQWVPLGDNFDALSSLAVLLSLFVVYVQRSGRMAGIDWFVMPVVVLLLVLALLFGPHKYEAYSTLVRGTWLW